MKLKILLSILSSLFAVTIYSQQNSCVDSSIRIKYIFDNNGAVLYNNPDTTGTNILTGELIPINPSTGIALLKTTWGDSMIWAKKILLNGTSRNSFLMPDGSVLCTGYWGPAANTELLLCKINPSGAVNWIKRFKLSPNHLYYPVSNNAVKNILIVNNAIYFTAVMQFNNQTYDFKSVIVKLDFNGNIIWSTGLKSNLPTISGTIGLPVFFNNSILILGNAKNQTTPGPGSESYSVLTRLNVSDGSLIESYTFKTISDTLIKGTSATFIKNNPDNSLSLTGFIDIEVIPGSGGYYPSNTVFNTLLDAGLNPLHNFFYTNNVPLDGSDFYSDFNNQKQRAFLSKDGNNGLNKYFVIFDKNDKVQRSRKFTTLTINSGVYRTSVSLDDKQNLHFINHYPQAGKIVTEYARISNFAPNGTLGCFGKDTSILIQYPFTITRQPFTWDNMQSNVIISNDVPYTEDTAIVTKELVCKIVSYCDSVYIKGPPTACIGQPLRYTVSKNNGCFKNSDWQIDTTYVTIVNTEGDSAITIRFTKAFTGYIHAAISDCVVKDSFFVTVLPSPIVKIATRDSLLCPGKTIVLKAIPGFTSYLWQDGSTADSFRVTTPGLYKVSGTDSCGFQTADSIVINNSDTSLIIPFTQTICKYDTAYITLPNDVNNITWQPTDNSLLYNKTLLLYPTQTTTYSITAERLVNCPISKTTDVVIKNCPQIVFIPNAFTPNNDSRNDIFKVSTFRPLQSYQLVIYNRYGQKIFETSNLSAGWDGTFKGSPQPTGGYTYHCSYRFTGGLQRTEAGYFILIR
jgi:gliding motility-associated-like protein